MTEKKLADFINPSDKFVLFPFYSDGKALDNQSAPLCGITLKSASSMRFRWNETNANRNNFFSSLLEDKKTLAPVELNHTKIVYDVSSAEELKGKVGDGIITVNPSLVPSVTVADCLPIYLYEPKSKVFGIVHSGWKGTGIAAEAIKLAEKKYGAKACDFYIVIGPHIGECCYIVNEERASYFSSSFSPDCVSPYNKALAASAVAGGLKWNNGNGLLYHLSLTKANLALLKKIGVDDEKITVYTDCTCCTEAFGSNRRETSLSGRPDNFTVMAAFIKN